MSRDIPLPPRSPPSSLSRRERAAGETVRACRAYRPLMQHRCCYVHTSLMYIHTVRGGYTGRYSLIAVRGIGADAPFVCALARAPWPPRAEEKPSVVRSAADLTVDYYYLRHRRHERWKERERRREIEDEADVSIERDDAKAARKQR